VLLLTSAVLVFHVAVGGRSRAEDTFAPELRSGDITRRVSGWWSAARAAVPGFGARIPGVGAEVGQLGAGCCHLVEEVLDVLQKCVDLGMADEMALTLEGSRLYQMLRRKS
jgi:hypothetical protein